MTTDILIRMNKGYSAGLRLLAADLNENAETLDLARAEIKELRRENAELKAIILIKTSKALALGEKDLTKVYT